MEKKRFILIFRFENIFILAYIIRGWYRLIQEKTKISNNTVHLRICFLCWKWNTTGILNTIYIFCSNSHRKKWAACQLQAGADNRLLLQFEIHVQFNCWLEDVISTGPPGPWVVGVGLGPLFQCWSCRISRAFAISFARANFFLFHPVFYLSPHCEALRYMVCRWDLLEWNLFCPSWLSNTPFMSVFTIF